MRLPRKNILVSILFTLLGLSLVSNIYLYVENKDIKDTSYYEFAEAKRALINSIEEYIATLEEVNNAEKINFQNVDSLTSSVLSSISQQHQIIIMLYYNFTNKENVNRYQDDFGEFWSVGLTEISDVETQDELEEHIKELKRLFGNFKEDLKAF